MTKIYFLSYISKITSCQEIDLPDKIYTVSEALSYLFSIYPELRENILSSEIIVIMDNCQLSISSDTDLKICGDLHLSPIIAGG